MQVTLPEMGESVTEGTVAKWLKQPGDPAVTAAKGRAGDRGRNHRGCGTAGEGWRDRPYADQGNWPRRLDPPARRGRGHRATGIGSGPYTGRTAGPRASQGAAARPGAGSDRSDPFERRGRRTGQV